MPIIRLVPACKDYIWGGVRLKESYGKQSNAATIAEAWELSCHADGPTLLESGQTLADYLAQNPAAAGTACARFAQFPVLVKLIDAAQPLSIQVHPSDSYALENEGQYGKTEMWYVVEAQPDAFLYYGFQHEISREEFRRRIQNDTLPEVLNAVPVQAGDCFFIEAGTIHAIGAGCLIAEVQQNSNVTYRVFDYGRTDDAGNRRALHIDKALAVTRLQKPAAPPANGHLAQCDYFTADLLNVDGSAQLTVDETSFRHLLVLRGQVDMENDGTTIHAAQGDGFFVPAASGMVTLQGRASVLMTSAGPKRYRIGIDLGGTNISAGIVDGANAIVAKHAMKTLAQRPWREVAADMAQTVLTALEKSGLTLADCTHVGVGCPGTVDAANGIVVYSNNFKDWEDIPLQAELERLLQKPVRISNDANCAALGECVAGAARGVQNAVLITLGTGVGGGVIVNGSVFEGGHAGGAELGHTVIVEQGEPCSCGRKGCLEAYASASALVRDAKRAALAAPDSLLNAMCEGSIERMNGRIPFNAARAGDPTAQAVVEAYTRHLGEGIANMVNIFRPDVVLLSGGISGEKEYLTNPLEAFLKTNTFAGTRTFIPPVRTAMLGNDAGIVGAANL